MVTIDEENAVRAVMLAQAPIVCRLDCDDCDASIIGTGWDVERAHSAAQDRLRRHQHDCAGTKTST